MAKFVCPLYKRKGELPSFSVIPGIGSGSDFFSGLYDMDNGRAVLMGPGRSRWTDDGVTFNDAVGVVGSSHGGSPLGNMVASIKTGVASTASTSSTQIGSYTTNGQSWLPMALGNKSGYNALSINGLFVYGGGWTSL